jgi:hypothetical protein
LERQSTDRVSWFRFASDVWSRPATGHLGPAQPNPHEEARSLLIGALVALLALGGSAAFVRMMAPAPSNPDLSTQLPTAQQRFVVSYTSSVTPPPINQLHRPPNEAVPAI